MQLPSPVPGWCRRHFNEDYRILYPHRDQAQADIEVDGAIRELAIRPGDQVLDLCCGFGRHLVAFARRGVAAVGVDISMSLLRQVDRRAARLACADMRALPFAGGARGFSVLVNFFTSFGYFEADHENRQAASEMSRVLRPGGRFALDLMNAAGAIRGLEPRTERRQDACRIVEERSHDARRRRIEKRITLVVEGSTEARSYFESVRIYDAAEIEALLRGVGLRVDRWLGDFSGAVFDAVSPRMIVIGRKPA
jgi:SAM-dependent methyltransferase